MDSELNSVSQNSSYLGANSALSYYWSEWQTPSDQNSFVLSLLHLPPLVTINYHCFNLFDLTQNSLSMMHEALHKGALFEDMYTTRYTVHWTYSYVHIHHCMYLLTNNKLNNGIGIHFWNVAFVYSPIWSFHIGQFQWNVSMLQFTIQQWCSSLIWWIFYIYMVLASTPHKDKSRFQVRSRPLQCLGCNIHCRF